MGYGGRQSIRSGDIRRFNFTGNGSNTAFDLGFTPATQNQLIVTVNGLVQHYDAFSISGSTLTFTGTPASGDTIQITAVVDAVGVAAIPDGAVANVSTLTVSGNTTLNGIFTATANVNIDAGTVFVDSVNNRVGINNTAPTSALTVTGNAAFSNTVAITGELTTASTIIANGQIRTVASGDPTIWCTNNANFSTGSTYMQFNTSSSEGRYGTYTNHPLVLLTNNSRQVIVDTTGRMTVPNQPGFKIGIADRTSTYSTGAAICTNNGFAFLADRDYFSRGGHFNTANGRFTAPVTGMYCFGYGIMRNADNTIISSGLDIRIMKNDGGSGTMYGRQYSGAYTSSYESNAATVITLMNANDWVTLNLWKGSLYSDDSWFFGYLIG